MISQQKKKNVRKKSWGNKLQGAELMLSGFFVLNHEKVK